MTQGTKIGSENGDTQFNPAVSSEEEKKDGFQATKMGEVSEFEREFSSSSAENDTTDKADDSSNQSGAPEPAVPDDDSALFQQAIGELDTNVPSNESFETQMGNMMIDFEEGDIVKGSVRAVEKSGVFVDFGYKSDGFVSNSEFSSDPSQTPENSVAVGDEIHVMIEKLETREGYTRLSRRKAEYEMAWGSMSQLAKNKEVVEATVTSKVQGGLVAEYKGIRGFIPSSQLLHSDDELMDKLVNTKMSVSVLKVDRRRRKVIFSQKVAASRSLNEDREKLLEELEVGQVREGVVTSIKDFGAFVDLGGLEGLVHISELSWSRVGHPSDILKVGDTVKVFVLGVDREAQRISLGMKQLEPDPWARVAQRFNIGDMVKGEITRVVSFGAFIELEENIEGLIHISELSYDHVDRVEDVVKVGQEVEARIVKLIPEEQKIGLSLKGVGTPDGLMGTADANDLIDPTEV